MTQKQNPHTPPRKSPVRALVRSSANPKGTRQIKASRGRGPSGKQRAKSAAETRMSRSLRIMADVYSARRASMGFIRDACRAG